MEKKKWNTKAMIPLLTAAFALVFIVLGITKYGFWSNQPMPGFFPVIIATILLLASIACFVQLVRSKDDGSTRCNKNELMVILGATGIILGTYLIGLVASCLVYLFVWLKFVERAPWKTIVIVEIILAAIVIGVFVVWLQVRFPLGLLQYIL